jgi:hypothetical protein
LKYGLNAEAKELNIASGISSGATVKTHDTKWLLEPVGATATNEAGVTYSRPLKVKLSDYGYNDYFASVCFPFDVLLPRGAYAFSCQSNTMRTAAQTGANGSTYYTLNVVQIAGEDMANKNQVIPANVPALLYVDGNALLDLTSPTEVPLTICSPETMTLSNAVVESLRNSALKYSFLTRELDSDEAGSNDLVYVFSKSGSNIGFMRNANKDYDNNKNNHFVLHNKIYYVIAGNQVQNANFIFLNYLDGLEEPDPVVTGVQDMKSLNHRTGDNTIYDLQGRKVPNVTRSGVYIVNGKKVVIRK